MSLFCKHDWEIKVKETFPSQAEIMKQIGWVPEKLFNGNLVKKILVIMACKKCGALDKTVEDNF